MEQKFAYTLKDLMEKNCVQFSKRQKIYLKFKRCMDAILSFIGLVILIPIFALIAIAVKIEEPHGTILYSQERIGRSGRSFKLYKFRSMRMDAPVLSTHEFSNAESYVTHVGHFIRHASIDELPQLWNVLVGDMSLVGPRPLLSKERDVHMLRFYYGLYQLRPGITGLAQINGRDDMNDYDKVRWDRKYVKEVSLSTDTKILWDTVFKVIKKEGVLDKNGPPSVVSSEEKKCFEDALQTCEESVKAAEKGERI